MAQRRAEKHRKKGISPKQREFYTRLKYSSVKSLKKWRAKKGFLFNLILSYYMASSHQSHLRSLNSLIFYLGGKLSGLSGKFGEWYLSRKAIFLCKSRNDFNRFKRNPRRSWNLLITSYSQKCGVFLFMGKGKAGLFSTETRKSEICQR